MRGRRENSIETGDARLSGGTPAVQGVLGMMVRRLGRLRWVDDTVMQQGRILWMRGGSRSVLPPQTEIVCQEEGAGRFQK